MAKSLLHLILSSSYYVILMDNAWIAHPWIFPEIPHFMNWCNKFKLHSWYLFLCRYLIASHTTDYQQPVLFLNTLAVFVLVVAKFPNMHKVRIFGINGEQ